MQRALACYEVCPAEVFDIQEIDRTKKAVVARPENCIECEWCVEACPEDTIKLVEGCLNSGCYVCGVNNIRTYAFEVQKQQQ